MSIANQCKDEIAFGPDSYGFSERMNGTAINPNPLNYKFRTNETWTGADGSPIESCEDTWSDLCYNCGTNGGTLCAATIREMLVGQTKSLFTEEDWTSLCLDCYDESSSANGSDDDNNPCADHKCPTGQVAVGTRVDNGAWDCKCQTKKRLNKLQGLAEDNSELLVGGALVGFIGLMLALKT